MFLKWFLYYYYDKKLLDTYKLHIIDKDANITTMDSCDDEICNKIILLQQTYMSFRNLNHIKLGQAD